MAKKVEKKAVKKKVESDADGLSTPAARVLPIQWPPDPGTAQFANNIVVQSDDEMLFMTFFQLNPPMLIAPDAESRRKLLEQLPSIEPQVIARIALPLEKLEAAINALQSQLEQHRAKERLGDSDGESKEKA